MVFQCFRRSTHLATNDSATPLKCFRRSTLKTRSDSSPPWFSRIRRRFRQKIGVIPVREEVSDQSVPKEEYDRVLQNLNSVNDQLSRKDDEIDMLKICQNHDKGNLFPDYETQNVEIMSKDEYDRVLRERNSINDQLSQRDEETAKLKQKIMEKDEQLDILKSELRGLKDDLQWLLTYSDIDPWIRSILGSSNKTKGQTREGRKTMEQPSLAVAGPQVASRYREKTAESEKNRVKRVEIDIIGATPTPTIVLSSSGTPTLLLSCSETPPKAATPTMDRLPMSPYSHAEIFRTLMRKGVISPPIPRIPSDESHPIHRPAYHRGSRGHSTENLKLQMDDSMEKMEPPETVVGQDDSSGDKLPSEDERAAGF